MVRGSWILLGHFALISAVLTANAAETNLPDNSPGRIARLATPAAAQSPAAAAAKVDEILRQEVPATAPTAKAIVSDGLYLRRARLDIVGRLPSPEEITAFVLDPASDKRAKLVEQLLADERYGANWGRYWRDVIMYRKTEERAQFIVSEPLLNYLQTELNQNSPWSKIATDMITATGDATANGACALIIAQQGMPEEVTAEVSRIFLGVQMSCAQCHDHPTDRWKREEFHQMAAFFPRIASRVILMPDRREISVVANDNPPPRFRGPMNMRRFGTPEHYMSDLQNPQARGTLMEPVLFATGDKLPLGTRDADRRGTLAQWITARDNPFFAKALVNRLWSELVGEGFYEPVDDIGPDRQASAPQTLEYLAGQFAANNYDVKWLFQTILATKAYQMPSASRRGPEDPPFQANVSQRLRADVIYDNVFSVLGVREPTQQRGGMYGGMGRFRGGGRGAFAAVFGYDPSERREEIQTSIPQALVLMNSPNLSGAIRASGFGFAQTSLSRLLREFPDDTDVVSELYLRTLARQPSREEIQTCLSYATNAASRGEAFEDIQWSLINSTEFLHRN
jgi:hypothetical protein